MGRGFPRLSDQVRRHGCSRTCDERLPRASSAASRSSRRTILGGPDGLRSCQPGCGIRQVSEDRRRLLRIELVSHGQAIARATGKVSAPPGRPAVLGTVPYAAGHDRRSDNDLWRVMAGGFFVDWPRTAQYADAAQGRRAAGLWEAAAKVSFAVIDQRFTWLGLVSVFRRHAVSRAPAARRG